jgi:hypothetical protein
MPRACPVVAHVWRNKHEAPRGKRVVSQEVAFNSCRSSARETPRDEPVASFRLLRHSRSEPIIAFILDLSAAGR